MPGSPACELRQDTYSIALGQSCLFFMELRRDRKDSFLGPQMPPPHPDSLCRGTHGLHDPGDSGVLSELLHKQMVLTGHLKGFGEEVTLGCLYLPGFALQHLPETLEILYHVVLSGKLGSRGQGQTVSLLIPALPTSF